MRRLLCVLALLLCAGAAATLLSGIRQDASLSATKDAADAINGAFRDGLYLGKLAAERGSEIHIASGRWAMDQDRASFSMGYEQGYNKVLRSRARRINRLSQAE
jgi:hypothetical protein